MHCSFSFDYGLEVFGSVPTAIADAARPSHSLGSLR